MSGAILAATVLATLRDEVLASMINMKEIKASKTAANDAEIKAAA